MVRYGMVWYCDVWYGMAWCGMVWHGTDRVVAWEVVLAGAGSMSGATAWGGQQAGASTAHGTVVRTTARIISRNPRRVVLLPKEYC